MHLTPKTSSLGQSMGWIPTSSGTAASIHFTYFKTTVDKLKQIGFLIRHSLPSYSYTDILGIPTNILTKPSSIHRRISNFKSTSTNGKPDLNLHEKE